MKYQTHTPPGPSAMSLYPTPPSSNTFAQAREAFDSLITKLSSTSSRIMDHAEIEALVDDDGTEVLRCLLQGHLDLRAQTEDVVPVVGADNVQRRHRRRTSRQLMSLFGGVAVHRVALSMRKIPALMPLDAALNLPGGLYSFGVRKRQIIEAANGSFDQVVEGIERGTGASVSKRHVERAVVDGMVDFDAFYGRELVDKTATDAFIAITVDGKGVVMRPDGLRAQTRKAAEKSENKLTTRLSAGEKSNRKRMAEVAAVYSVAPWIRTPDQVLKKAGCGPLKPRPRPKNKRVWASLVKPAKEVIQDAFEEAAIQDPKLTHRWLVLVDGNKDQVRYARASAKSIGQPITLILDIVHAIEYVWKAAWALFPSGDRAAERWVLDKLRRLLDGKVSSVAAGIRRSATKRKLTGSKRKAMDKCADYLLNHKDMMRYDVYLAAGMPIGTGVIEGACRHLIKDRMDITGARWGLPGAEAVIKARALRISGDIDAYWDFHRRQELKRNHLIRYHETELQTLRGAG